MAEERLEEIRQARLARRAKLIETGRNPYPAEARRTHELGLIADNFADLMTEGGPMTVVGRVTAQRGHGQIVFIDLKDGTGKLQLQLTEDGVAEGVWERLETLDVGDFIQAAGKLIESKRGEQTLETESLHMLAKSIRPVPTEHHGLKDPEKRFRQREVDMLVNPSVRETLRLRARVLDYLRHELTDQGFLEVETPILQPMAGGAIAEPFVTHHNALKSDLYLRIAPELYLKRLLVGGIEKVFEIGRIFRNEGIDRDHNPEFTMCEFYWAYADYEDLMDMTEKLLSEMCRALLDKEEVEWNNKTISFAMPWKRVRYIEIVSQALGVNILEDKDPLTYENILKDKNLEIPKVKTYAKLVDELYKELVRPSLIQPTLVYDYPVELAPLAKRSVADKNVAEKFQLLMGGTELINAYSELNDPVEQRQRFEEQAAARDAGDREAQLIDEDYLRAMEYGMPPAGGWGLGVDRLVSILAGTPNVRETMAFPLLKPQRND